MTAEHGTDELLEVEAGETEIYEGVMV